MYHNLVTPRFVTCVNHDMDSGNIKEYTWDRDKLHIEAYLTDDLLMLQNVFEGKIISPSIYPLIYDTKAESKEITLRSLEFYREVDANPELYKMLSTEEKTYFLIGIRDLFVASCRKLLNDEEKSLLMRIVELVDPSDPDIICKKIKNVDVTPYPTSSHKVVRFLDEKSETIADECFIRNELNLLLGFVDPKDLSYHNFENIINLDSVFANEQCEFKISNVEKHPMCEIYGFKMTDKSKVLLSLDNYELYTQPLNKLSRGGERFIFLSEILSNELTQSIKDGLKHKKLITSKFRFVNYVFRYNKFSPGDHKFTSHYDTPYYDPARKHYSKYTLVLYLTSGTADPVLSFDNGNVKIDNIDTKGEVRGIIFDQKYEHEGKCFVNGDKIFLRSELIFEYDHKDGLTFDEEVSRKFNVACYMTKQSVFNQELEKYASECFNQVAQARINMGKNQKVDDYLVYKKYNDIPFITNGYDYWFNKKISLKEAGTVALLDHFNCKFDSGVSFNKLTYNEVIVLDIKDVEEILKYLSKGEKSELDKVTKKNSNEMECEEFKEIEKEEVMKFERTEMEIEDWNEFKQNYIEGIEYKDNGDDEDYVNNENGESESSDDDEFEEEAISSEEEKIERDLSEEEKVGDEQIKKKDDEEEDEDEDEDEDEEEYEDEEDEEENSYDPNEDTNCCPDHNSYFYAWGNYTVKKLLEKKTAEQDKKLEDLIKGSAIYIFDKKVNIQKENIRITEQEIIFEDRIPGVNFAATRCWDEKGKPEDYIKSKSKEIAAFNSIPPIMYKTYSEGYHLKIELFSSRFVRKKEDVIQQYSIIDDEDENSDEDEDKNEGEEDSEEDEDEEEW